MYKAFEEDSLLAQGDSAGNREQVLNVAFPRGQLGLHLTPLANHFGAAFDGWKELGVSKSSDVADDKEMLSAGDRLFAIDGTNVLDTLFHDIIQRLTHKPKDTNGGESASEQAGESLESDTKTARTRLFHLQFIKPASTQTIMLDEAVHHIDAWFRPANTCFYDCTGAVYVAPVGVEDDGVTEQKSPQALEGIKQGVAVIAVNEQAVAGLFFEDVLRLIRTGDYPVTVVFGHYVQGAKTSTLLHGPKQSQSAEYLDSDALACATGVRFVEAHNTSTRDCIREGDRDTFRARLQAGLSLDIVDSQGRTLLLCAASSKDPWFLNVLLEEGSDVSSADVNGNTSLHIAAGVSHGASIIRTLVAHGASLSEVNLSDWTPLHVAAHGGNEECLKTLISEKARGLRKYVDKTEIRFGWSALHFAAMAGNLRCVKLLLRAGANPHIETKLKETPLQMARESCQLQIAALLHEVLCDEPLQPVWPKGGVHAEGQHCGEIPWHPVNEELSSCKEKRRSELQFRVDKYKARQKLPGLRRNHQAKEVNLDDFVSSPNPTRIWIGNKEALRSSVIANKQIESVLLISSEPANAPHKAWAREVDVLSITFRTGVGATGWKEFLTVLPKAIEFVHRNYAVTKKNLLIASTDKKSKPMSRQVSLLVAYLLLKQRVPLKISFRDIQARCYYYSYKQALLKHKWIKTHNISSMFDDAFQKELESRDTRPAVGDKRKEPPWAPGLKRASVVDPVFVRGLEDLADRKHERDLQAARRKVLDFRKSFITLLN